MNQDRLFSISGFARLSGISRDNLIFYDRSGILKPERIGRNGYRYYSFRQLGTAYLLMTLKESGMALKKIKDVSAARTPESMVRIFAEQKNVIQNEIERMRQRLWVIQAHERSIHEADAIRERGVEVRTLPAEPIYRGPVIRNFVEEKMHDYYHDFFDLCAADGIPPVFPMGCEISKGSFHAKKKGVIHRLYFRIPQAKAKRPAGRYAIGYARGDYHAGHNLYDKLTSFIAKKGMRIVGNIYEEFILDEISTTDPDKYLMRVIIPVRES